MEWAEGWGGAPVGATLSTPFLINQSWFTSAFSARALPGGSSGHGRGRWADSSGPEHLLGCGSGPPGDPGLTVL